MKRLLFMLSCLLCLSSCTEYYETSHVATLEELDGYNATLTLKDSSTVVKVKLVDTLDCYSKAPLKAEGQKVILYNSNLISQVDQDILNTPYNKDGFLYFAFLAVVVVMLLIGGMSETNKIPVQCTTLFLALSVFFAGFICILKYVEPPYKIVSYGKIIRIDKAPNSNIPEIVIETENNKQEYYQISSSMFNIPDDKTEEMEGLIYKVRGRYGFYQNLGQDKDILETTLAYKNKRNIAVQKLVRNLMFASLSVTIIFFICQFIIWITHKKRIKAEVEKQTKLEEERLRQEQKLREQRAKLALERLRQEQELQEQRAKIEQERLRQEALKQQEIIHNCEKYVNEFLQDFLDSSEETSVLLARLKLKLEKSGYENWQKDFYADVEKKAKAYQRPSQEQRQKASSQDGDFSNFGDLLIDFNGVFVTPVQYQILSKNSKARNLSGAQVLELCRKLAETRPEFASFKEVRDIQPYVAKDETNEAFRLFGLTSETLTVESLKQAYRRLVQKYHPDRNKEPNAVEMFQKVQRYYAYLEGLARS